MDLSKWLDCMPHHLLLAMSKDSRLDPNQYNIFCRTSETKKNNVSQQIIFEYSKCHFWRLRNSKSSPKHLNALIKLKNVSGS